MLKPSITRIGHTDMETKSSDVGKTTNVTVDFRYSIVLIGFPDGIAISSTDNFSGHISLKDSVFVNVSRLSFFGKIKIAMITLRYIFSH